MTTRIVDNTGAAWPDTGRVCAVCGWPTLLDDVHELCRLQPGPAPTPAVDGQPARLCRDCGQPLPTTTGVGVACHLVCWQTRKAALS